MIFLGRSTLVLCTKEGICAVHPCPHIDAQKPGVKCMSFNLNLTNFPAFRSTCFKNMNS